MRLFFMLPVIMCLVWAVYLKLNDYELKQGMGGFIKIIGFNLVLALFLTVMIYVTR